MSKNPFINAVGALVYIILVVLVMNFGMRMTHNQNPFIAPLAVISLFSLSAAVMAYIFGYQPVQLYFDGSKKQAVRLFLQTVAVFAVITFIIFALLISRILPSY